MKTISEKPNKDDLLDISIISRENVASYTYNSQYNAVTEIDIADNRFLGSE